MERDDRTFLRVPLQLDESIPIEREIIYVTNRTNPRHRSVFVRALIVLGFQMVGRERALMSTRMNVSAATGETKPIAKIGGAHLQTRFDFRLRESSPDEREVISALYEVKDVYGARTEINQSCMYAGYMGLKAGIDEIPYSELRADPVAAIERVVRPHSNNPYSARAAARSARLILEAVLESHDDKQPSEPAAAGADQSGERKPLNQHIAPVIGDREVGSDKAALVDEAYSLDDMRNSNASGSERAEKPSKAPPDWSVLRGIAGTANTGGGEK